MTDTPALLSLPRLARDMIFTWSGRERRIFRSIARRHGLRWAIAYVRDPYWH